MSQNYLYEVKLVAGKRNVNYSNWLQNLSELNAKTTDYGGVQSLCILSHSKNAVTVHMLCTRGFKDKDKKNVTVNEITRQTLATSGMAHHTYIEFIEENFLFDNRYPSIEE